jgi:hypothetical protein
MKAAGTTMSIFKYFLSACIVLFLFFIGIEREAIFISLNLCIQHVTNAPDFLRPNIYGSIYFLFYLALYFFKWMLTLLFTCGFLFFACLSIYLIYQKKSHIYICLFFFTAVFLLAFSFMAIGYVFHEYNICYLFSRKLMGLAQSPALLIILIPSFKLLKE